MVVDDVDSDNEELEDEDSRIVDLWKKKKSFFLKKKNCHIGT